MSDELIKLKFPTMLRKMWSGGEVQEWLDKLPPLYTHPAKTLTDEEIDEIISEFLGKYYKGDIVLHQMISAILRKAQESR